MGNHIDKQKNPVRDYILIMNRDLQGNLGRDKKREASRRK
jgi:hypothetical protein